jgi:hypothetical protein
MSGGVGGIDGISCDEMRRSRRNLYGEAPGLSDGRAFALQGLARIHSFFVRTSREIRRNVACPYLQDDPQLRPSRVTMRKMAIATGISRTTLLRLSANWPAEYRGCYLVALDVVLGCAVVVLRSSSLAIMGNYKTVRSSSLAIRKKYKSVLTHWLSAKEGYCTKKQVAIVVSSDRPFQAARARQW